MVAATEVRERFEASYRHHTYPGIASRFASLHAEIAFFSRTFSMSRRLPEVERDGDFWSVRHGPRQGLASMGRNPMILLYSLFLISLGGVSFLVRRRADSLSRRFVK